MKDVPMIAGRDLVEFDRRETPIYQERPSLWAEAGVDAVSYGAPLDRLFGAPTETHVAAHAPLQDVTLPVVEDPIVELGTLTDVLAVADLPPGLLGTPLAHETPLLTPLHDGWGSDSLGTDWTFDL
jgi:hypothetical protein